MTRMDSSRSRWYSRLVSVCEGATTMLSPVWMPSGSKFSMLQTVMQLSWRSRTTSYSISFQPRSDSSTRIWPENDSAWSASGAQLLRGGAEAAAQPAQGVGRADDHRVAQLPRRRQRLVDAGHGGAAGRADADLVEPADEPLAVLGVDDRLDRRAEDPHAVFFQDAVPVQGDAAVEGGLAAEGEQDPVGALAGR